MADHILVVEHNVTLTYVANCSFMNFNLSTKWELPFIFMLKKILCMCSVISDFVYSMYCSMPGSSVHVSRQKYCGGLPFPSPKHLPDPGIKTVSPVSPALAGGFFTTELPGKLKKIIY